MSMEVVDTALEYAPIAGAIAGYATGVAAESIVCRRAAAERLALSEVMGEAADSLPTESKRQLLIGRASGALALAGIFVGGVNGFVWQQDAPDDNLPASIKIVADRSGSTGFGTEDYTPSERINDLVGEFSHDDTKVRVFVARGNDVSQVKANDIASVGSLGDAPMRRAYNFAREDAAVSDDKADSERSKSAVVVLTNNNPITRADMTKEQLQKSDSPVYIVNVSAESNSSAEKELKRVSKETGGEYWNQADLQKGELSDAVNDKLSPAVENAGSGSDWPIKVAVGAFSLWAFMRLAKFRRNMPLTYKGSSPTAQ